MFGHTGTDVCNRARRSCCVTCIVWHSTCSKLAPHLLEYVNDSLGCMLRQAGHQILVVAVGAAIVTRAAQVALVSSCPDLARATTSAVMQGECVAW